MKPIIINLSLYVNIMQKVFMVIATLLFVTAFGFSAVNAYNYFSKNSIIEEHVSKIEHFRKQAENKEQKKIKKELGYLISIIEKDLVPFPKVLTEIEQYKPEIVDIHELTFSDNLKNIIIKGESGHFESVSLFFTKMEQSKHFAVKHIKQGIKENRNILFELTIEWKKNEKT